MKKDCPFPKQIITLDKKISKDVISLLIFLLDRMLYGACLKRGGQNLFNAFPVPVFHQAMP